ncbi:coenzyme F420-0:L-glutamate ligase/coenzyme F420-1:gamma-L-glutamate ligase [Methanofollis sp. W23]|uniref:coenzyme F420-0:L-glutamate ligase n=1 Tax=Methanofollis sp. W23 TaxID=2817849 RepID=UPI001AE67A63|nr:coenzyme F420-0:L-glutamate ligase [Methanofollis sp. W23]MBP2145699.1 coenzyme F420-0:L-glutamate ligase/coenzyme F420-1:gamma-L-glutamate ligase [Methanofollis sp. W23]
MHIEVIPVKGLPLIHQGDDLAEMICRQVALEDGDILCLASSVYSKAHGHTRLLDEIVPSGDAERIAQKTHEDPRFIQAVLDDTTDVILEEPFILSETVTGHIGVRAGLDHSNVEDGMIVRLPPDPMQAASGLCDALKAASGKEVRVIITDTCGRSFRRGQAGVAIGWSGMTAIRDFRGDHDLFGHTLEITEEAVVDEVAGFSNFVMGESNNGIPVVVFRNCPGWTGHDDLHFRKDEDLIRQALDKN